VKHAQVKSLTLIFCEKTLIEIGISIIMTITLGKD